jgi:hypothetical protein
MTVLGFRATAARPKLDCREGVEGDAVFDSPFEFCAVCRGYVLLDQTKRQCAREHRCAGVAKCPLERYFTGIEFREGRPEAKARRTKG